MYKCIYSSLPLHMRSAIDYNFKSYIKKRIYFSLAFEGSMSVLLYDFHCTLGQKNVLYK